MKTIDDVSLIDIMPDSISRDKNVAAVAAAIDIQLRALAGYVDVATLVANIDTLPSGVLDHLAAEYDVSVWRDSWPVATKRSVLKNSLSDKRKRGTRAAVVAALASLGSAASIVEWWEQSPKGDPHTFKIYATLPKTGAIDAEVQEDLIKMIDDAKPLRSHYDFILQQSVDGGVGVCAYIRPLTVARI